MTAAAQAGDRPAGGARRFDERFLRKLETLELAVRRAAGARARGIRRTRRIGAGLELADHRDYVPGDDLRYLDWNLYGRLDRRALRLFEEDEDVAIDVIVDASGSMAMGAPPKIDLALQLGAALAYVGLANLDRVAVTALGDAPASLPAQRGKNRILGILRFFEAVTANGRQPLSSALRAHLGRRAGRRGGVAVLISDFYDPAGARAALDLLRANRLTPIAIQVTAPDELAPALRGDVRVRDVETGETHDLTISPAAVTAYLQRLAALRRALEGHCRERGIPCFAVTSDQPLDAVVLRMFRAGGLLG
ncbi:MAG TPA: DUF58 domain-containing protein [Polyangia bacterium]|nr:DUF58 domain-containing protein [Polyangia bacterium]